MPPILAPLAVAVIAPVPPPLLLAAGPDAAAMAGWFGLLLPTSVLAALLTGTINLTLARRRSREDERARVRSTFAEAFKAYAEYREFPQAISRRDVDRAAEERQRLFEALRQLNSRLSYYRMWALLEAPAVGSAYAELLEQLDSVTEKAMRIAWATPVAADDIDANLDPGLVDLTPLAPYEQAFREAVAVHLHKLAPRWA